MCRLISDFIVTSVCILFIIGFVLYSFHLSTHLWRSVGDFATQQAKVAVIELIEQITFPNATRGT